MDERAQRFPPRDLDELKAILERSRTLGSPRFGRRTFAALSAMVQNPNRAAVQTIFQLAEENNVDPSTLTRLGQRLGFRGFSELQAVFRKHMVERDVFYSRQTSNILTKRAGSTTKPFVDFANEEIERLAATASNLNEADVNRAAQFICDAENVYVLGMRPTHGIAYFMGAFAKYLRNRVSILGGAGMLLAEDLAQMTSGDVLVALTFRPYTRSTVDACRQLLRRKIPVVALTDAGSPVALEGKRYVSLQCKSPFYFDSAVSSIFLAEVLLSAVAHQLGNKALHHLENVEHMLRELAIELDEGDGATACDPV